MLMPSHAKIVKPYKEPAPLFAKYGIEAQLDAMFSNQVTLKSGGYLVINPTEALVSIDVNSGRSTREHNIEDTALKTNLEAAEEIARQLRLRDLAGLIVIDFIDMEEKRNNRSVEKKLNECLKSDRARIQVGRISPFGLLEMSRQRIRTGVLESSSVPCPHCAGSGFVRGTPSIALHVLRSVEELLIKSASHNLVVRTRLEPAFYILNQKRVHLRELETRFAVSVAIVADEDLTGTTTYAIDKGDPALRIETKAPATSVSVQIDAIAPAEEAAEVEPEVEPEIEEADEAVGDEARAEETRADGQGDGRRRRRRRRRRGRGDREYTNGGSEAAGEGDAEEGEDLPVLAHAEDVAAEPPVAVAESADGDEEDRAGRRRRRGRRGGRGRGRDEFGHDSGDDSAPAMAAAGEAELSAPAIEAAPSEDAERVYAPSLFEAAPVAAESTFVAEEAVAEPEPEEVKAGAPEPDELASEKEPEEREPVAIVLTPSDPDRPKRAGWWSRAKSVISGS